MFYKKSFLVLISSLALSYSVLAEDCSQYGVIYDNFDDASLFNQKWGIGGINPEHGGRDGQAQVMDGMARLSVLPTEHLHGVDLLLPDSQLAARGGTPSLIQADLTLDPSSTVSGPENGIGVRIDGVFYNDGVNDVNASIGVDRKQFVDGEKDVLAIHIFRKPTDGVIGGDIVPWQVIRPHDGKPHRFQIFWDGKAVHFTVDQERVYVHTPRIINPPKNPRVNITAFAFPYSSTIGYIDNIYFGDDSDVKKAVDCYQPKPSIRRTKIFPQILMAGFDPPLIDRNDKEIRFVAVVEEGAHPIENVGLKVNPIRGQSGVYFGMDLRGRILLDEKDKRYGLVYETKLYFSPYNSSTKNAEPPLPEGSLAQQLGGYSFLSMFGYKPFQFSIVARDGFQQTVSYPRFSYDSYPANEVNTNSETTTQLPYQGGRIKRENPQIIMAGLSPTLMDFSESQLKVMAIVRPGAATISTVTLNDLDSKIPFLSLSYKHQLPNGDLFYEGTVLDTQGELLNKDEFGRPAEISLWDVWNTMVSVNVADESGNTHEFPDLRVGKYPTINR